MAKGIILGAPGELADPEAITQSDLDRAAEAVANAPMTEHGIVIPPHVAEEQAPQHAGPNRAQRRAWERSERQKGRASRRPKAKPTPGAKRQAAAQELAAPNAMDRAVDLIRSAKAEEMKHMEKLLRDAGGVDLG